MSPLFLRLFLIVPAFILFWWSRSRTSSLLPPGPRRLPFVGNLFNAPTNFAWRTYAEWSKKYGSDLLYINVLGTHIVIANTQEVASNLLDKRSRIYSARPCSYMASSLIECDWILACLPYNDAWRVSRRLLAKYFSRSSTGSRTSVVGFTDFEWQRPHVVKYTRYFLRNLLQKPDSFMEHTFSLTASVSVSSTHGLDESAERDEQITLAKKASDALKFALVPGRFLVDTFPVLRFAPEWVTFKRLAKSWKEDVRRFLEVPFMRAKENLSRQNYDVEIPSFLSQELNKPNPIDQRVLQEASATVFIGATSTTSAALNAFFLVMTCYPEAQKRAQAELDSLLSKQAQKLPTHADLENLPFCMALVYEVLRWHVVGPIGLPHLSTEEDVFEGYRIPEGSVIIPNIWAMMRDPKKFSAPTEFLPERFLNPDGSLSDSAVEDIDPVFGFGRRVCVGRSMALSILTHAVCCVLAVFNIEKRLDEKGGIIEPRVEFESSITSSPLPFVCSIKPRSSEAKNVIMQLFDVGL